MNPVPSSASAGSTGCFDGDCPRMQDGPANRKIARVFKIWNGRVAVVTLVFIVASYIAGASVPSDHLPTGTRKMVSGSGRERGSSTTGEPLRFAPQVAPSVFGI